MVMLPVTACGQGSLTIDTLCLPTEKVRKVLIAAEQKKALEVQVSIMDERIRGLQGQIQAYKAKDSATVVSYEKQLLITEGQKSAMLEEIAGLKREVRREKRRRIFTGAVGMLTTAAAVYIAIKN
jgi:hypothetical protein